MTERPRVSVVVPACNEGKGGHQRIRPAVRVGAAAVRIELTAKAKRVSNFKIAKWVPSYLHWYRFAFAPRQTADQVRHRGTARQPGQREGARQS